MTYKNGRFWAESKHCCATGAQDNAVPSVSADDAQHNTALSAQPQNIILHEKCAAGVPIFSGQIPAKDSDSGQRVLNAWSSLPESIRAAILALLFGLS